MIAHPSPDSQPRLILCPRLVTLDPDLLSWQACEECCLPHGWCSCEEVRP
jgi:hypothetical protein